MARLQLYLLGPFKVVLDGQPLTKLRSDKTSALLAYLAVEAGIPHRRGSLAALLWGDHPREAARASLRVSLSNLHQALASTEADSLLEITRKHIQFNFEADLCWSDVAAFDALLAACQSHSHSDMQHCPVCIQRLAQAVDLYRGDFLLDLLLSDSAAFDEWRVLCQETYHRQALDAFEVLTIYHTSLGNYAQAQDYARRQIAMEPWREQAHVQLMHVLALDGQRGAALAQYEDCRRILTDDLGAEPSAETVAVYEQIRAEALREQCDGASSISVCPGALHNFPAQLTPFIGRKEELTQIVERLGADDVRLLTLAGSGGIGKTRLALQAAGHLVEAFQDGAYYVPLAAVHAPASMAVALAQVLQVPLRGDQDSHRQLLDCLGERQALLVLDTMEHLRDGANFLLDILGQSPGVKILVTSRERLDLPGEAVFLLEGLDFAAGGEGRESMDCDAIQLFLQSAHRARPDFTLLDKDLPSVIQICGLVNGIPLAIELAAAWVQVFSCRDIARHIERDLDFLTTTLPIVTERHRSLRTVIDHSWRLLSAQECDVLRRLSVAHGGLDGEAAQKIADADSTNLATLVDKSLLYQEVYEGEISMTRYAMHGLLQHYATERLAQDPDAASDAQDRHGDYFLRLLQGSEGQLKGDAQRQAMERLWGEIDNVRAAWAWMVDRRCVALIASALNGLFLFYELGGLFQEGETAFEALVDQLADVRSDEERLVLGRASVCQGWFAFRLGRQSQAREMLHHSLTLLNGLDAVQGVVFCLNCLIEVNLYLGVHDEALCLCQRNLDLSRQIGDRYAEAVTLNLWGLVAIRKGDHHEARGWFDQSLDIARTERYSRVEADNLRSLGIVLYRLGDYAAACGYYEQALHFAREIGDRVSQAALLNNLGNVYLDQGDDVSSQACYEEALHISRELGDRLSVGLVLNSLGLIASYRGDYAQAAVYYGQSLAICREIGDREGEAVALCNLGIACRRRGDYAGARDNYEQALCLFADLEMRHSEGEVLAYLGLLYHQLGDDQAAYDCSQRARDILHDLGVRRLESYAQMNLGRALEGLGRMSEAGDVYRRVMALRCELGQEHLLMEPLAGLARLYLSQGEIELAQTQVDEILAHLASCGLDNVDDPASLYLTCCDVLRVGGDPRADDILLAAHNWLQECVARIDDAEMRRAFLEDVAVHRDLIAMWVEAYAET